MARRALALVLVLAAGLPLGGSGIAYFCRGMAELHAHRCCESEVGKERDGPTLFAAECCEPRVFEQTRPVPRVDSGLSLPLFEAAVEVWRPEVRLFGAGTVVSKKAAFGARQIPATGPPLFLMHQSFLC